jgi:protein-S-isoprenylcysteine O-methyltransferase Ste14
MVRIQAERGHRAISGGPYRWMRHPGYAGAVLTHLTTALLLNSWWALVPAVVVSGVLVVRTALEDRYLQEQLEGYREYAGQVRYRLLPGVW